MPAGSLNIALLVDDPDIPEWQFQMVQQIIKTRRVHLRLVIVDRADTVGGMSATLLDGSLHLLRAVDRLWGGTPLKPLRRRALHTLCRPENLYNLTDEQLPTQYAKHDIDVLLQLGQHKAPPEWLCRASRYGVWRMFTGNVAQPCDARAGLQEYVVGADKLYSGILRYQFLQQTPAQPLSRSYRQRYVFVSSGSVHPAFLHRTLEPVLWKMSAILPRLLEQLRDSRSPNGLLEQWDQRYRGRADLSVSADVAGTGTTVSWRLLYRVFARSLRAKGRALYNKVLRREVWVLLYGERSQPGDLTTLQRLMPPAGTFWADPQLFIYRQRRFIFLEEWVDAQQKGRIVCIEWYGGDRFSAAFPVLEEAYHLSYPHVFKFFGSYYMVPESADNKTISLYRCTRFPDRWEFVHHLMENVAAYDATLCEHAGRWWMFVNMRQHPYSSSDDLLYLYSADSPLSQQWLSHPSNPIVTDVSSARPAGKILRLGDKLYRPSQNCAASYGRGLNLNQIISWNDNHYQERTLGQYMPDGKAGLYGMHTFSMPGNAVLSDGVVRQPRRVSNSWQWMNNKNSNGKLDRKK